MSTPLGLILSPASASAAREIYCVQFEYGAFRDQGVVSREPRLLVDLAVLLDWKDPRHKRYLCACPEIALSPEKGQRLANTLRVGSGATSSAQI
jgi:hypothetical protein